MQIKQTISTVLLLSSLATASPEAKGEAAAPELIFQAASPKHINEENPINTGSKTYNGIATYYTQDGAYGSCGKKHSDSDKIVAISEKAPFKHNAYCGQKVTITNMGGGQDNHGKGHTITATVADTCPSCENSHLDLSTGAFKALTGGSLDPPGTFKIQWHFD